MLTGSGRHVGVLPGENGTLLIASQLPQPHDRNVAAISPLGDGPVRFVANTNWHYDHAMGNELFRKGGDVIVGHENGPKRMASEQVHDVIGSKSRPYPPAAWPEITVAEPLTAALQRPGPPHPARALRR